MSRRGESIGQAKHVPSRAEFCDSHVPRDVFCFCHFDRGEAAIFYFAFSLRGAARPFAFQKEGCRESAVKSRQIDKAESMTQEVEV